MSIERPIVATSDGEVPPNGVREPIRHLLTALDRMGVRYCHWKSNIRLGESLAGTGDLDLLVDRRDAARFQAALLENDFKLTQSGTGTGHPGVFHAFALDPERAKLIHVHAYFQIVTGDSLVKNYRLPFEETLLANTRLLHGVPVPAAEAELVLFTLRIALKHTSLAEMLLVRRYYSGVPRELNWLRAAADPLAAEAVWRAWLPGAPAGLFRDLMEAITEPDALARRIRLGRRLARHLRVWRRSGALSAAVSRSWRVAALALARLRRRRGLSPSASGIIIAFVGPKATGKSTLSAATARCLGQHFNVRLVHVGKPPVTALSLLPRLFLPLARRLLPGQRSGEHAKAKRRQDKCHSLLHVLWTTVLAYDRRALLRHCWRHAAAGSIVIADRYPSVSIGATDSSRFDDEALAQCGSRLKRWFMERERAIYANIPQPGLVIRLAAPLETTIRRDAERDKADGPDSAAVVRRRQMETDTVFAGARVVTVDTDQPLDQTLQAVMRAVWAVI
jgi:thymidylate kinase